MGELKKNLSQIVYDLAGPAAKEIGEMLKDELRPYRAARQLQLAEKAVRLIQNSDMRTRAVSPKVLIPILENGGLEDDEQLHDMWAALLANAADSRKAEIPASFSEILRQISSKEARFLDSLYRTALNEAKKFQQRDSIQNLLVTIPLGDHEQLRGEFISMFHKQSQPVSDAVHEEYSLIMDNLTRLHVLQLVRSEIPAIPERLRPPISGVPTTMYYFSPIGTSFILACQPPNSTP
jgi:hypothetical protein